MAPQSSATVPSTRTRSNLVHTGVPEESEGQGIAGKLARAAFAWARQDGMKLVVTCPFVRKWLERHPDEQDLVSPRPAGG